MKSSCGKISSVLLFSPFSLLRLFKMSQKAFGFLLLNIAYLRTFFFFVFFFFKFTQTSKFRSKRIKCMSIFSILGIFINQFFTVLRRSRHDSVNQGLRFDSFLVHLDYLRPSSVNFSHFKLLLRNHWANWNQT